MATPNEMQYYKEFMVGPIIGGLDNMCDDLFRDLFECQEKSPFPLRDCILYKEDFLECCNQEKKVIKL